jgi:hypothetical protein
MTFGGKICKGKGEEKKEETCVEKGEKAKEKREN